MRLSVAGNDLDYRMCFDGQLRGKLLLGEADMATVVGMPGMDVI